MTRRYLTRLLGLLGLAPAMGALPALGKEEAAPLQEGGFKIEPLRPWTEEQVNAFTEAVRYTMLAAVRDGRPMASLRTQEILDRVVEAPAGHPAPHLRQRCLSGAQAPPQGTLAFQYRREPQGLSNLSLWDRPLAPRDLPTRVSGGEAGLQAFVGLGEGVGA